MCVYVYIGIYTHTIYIYIYIHVHVCRNIYIYICIHTIVCMHACMHAAGCSSLLFSQAVFADLRRLPLQQPGINDFCGSFTLVEKERMLVWRVSVLEMQ